MWRLAATVLELLSAFLVLEVDSELVLLGDVVEATLLGIEQTLLKQIRRERRTDRSRKTLFELRSECSRSELATESAAEHEYTVAITPRKHVPSEMRKRCRRWSRRPWSACQTCFKQFATTMIQCVVSYIMEARRWLRSQQIGYASERFGRASERFSEQGSLYPGSPGQRTVSVGEEAASESR